MEQVTGEKGFVSKTGGSDKQKTICATGNCITLMWSPVLIPPVHIVKNRRSGIVRRVTGFDSAMATADSSGRISHPVLDLIGCADITLDEVVLDENCVGGVSATAKKRVVVQSKPH